MADSAWQAIGKVARKRRERLRLNQEDLALYGGPKVATVGKFERAAQEYFPTRTQGQMEAALGWPNGTIQTFLASYDSYEVMPSAMHETEQALVNENIPDLRRPELVSQGNLSGIPQNEEFEDLVLMMRSSLSRVPPDLWGDAALRAVGAISDVARETGISRTPRPHLTQVSAPDETLAPAANEGDIEESGEFPD